MSEGRQIIFSMVNVSRTLPTGKTILKDIYLSFYYGAKIGILGLNGSGKSTLLKIIAGVEKNYQGEIHFSPGYKIGMLEQEPHLDDTKTVIEIVREGAQEHVNILNDYEAVNNKFAEEMSADDMDKLINRQAKLQDLIDQYDLWNLDNRLEQAMEALRCPESDTLVKNLSGGERRRVALCRLLIQEPEILLLDEPTNHLDIDARESLAQALKEFEGSVIFVSHDRHFVSKIATRIISFTETGIIDFHGSYHDYLVKYGNDYLNRSWMLSQEAS